MPTITIEVVTRFNLRGLDAKELEPHARPVSEVARGFFAIQAFECEGDHLEEVAARLAAKESQGDIITYYYEEKKVPAASRAHCIICGATYPEAYLYRVREYGYQVCAEHSTRYNPALLVVYTEEAS